MWLDLQLTGSYKARIAVFAALSIKTSHDYLGRATHLLLRLGAQRTRWESPDLP